MEKEKKGLVHLYCGEGKGKTTAAVGLGVRAAGSGMKVLFLQLMKSGASAERKVLQNIPGFTLIACPSSVLFFSRMSPEQKQAAKQQTRERVQGAFEKAAEEEYDMLIADEAIGAADLGLIPPDLLLRLIENKPRKLEVVLTGRNPGERLCQTADYISEIRKIKHPYDAGISARPGIEY